MIDENCLYVSYTGMTESLGQSQVLSYIERVDTKSQIHLLSFENDPGSSDIQDVESRVQSQNIEWHWVSRSQGNTIVSKCIDILTGFLILLRLFVTEQFDIIHARSYIPMLLSLPFGLVRDTRLIFDIRGFWVDERVDLGSIKENDRLYYILKRVEKLLYRWSDTVITLTEVSAEIIENKYDIDQENIYVIPTCVDTDKFIPADNQSTEEFVVGYVGTVNEWHRFEDVLDCYCSISEQVNNTKLQIYNKGDEERIKEYINSYPKELDNICLTSASHSEMPKKYAEMDVGIFFYESTYSKKATCPTKMGEFLATGTPCLGNSGVGDVEKILEQNDVGVAISNFTTKEKESAIPELLQIVDDPDSTQRCRTLAVQEFSLERGVNELQKIYSEE